jgi:Protein of unknown function (DUF3035)
MGNPRLHRLSPTACLLTVTSLALAGCGDNGLSRTFGLVRDAPNEFTVTTQAPLSMPPDFRLRPPEPGAPRPMEQSEALQAEEALAPQTALAIPQSGLSAGQQALVQQAGPPAAPGIRQEVNQEARNAAAANDTFMDKVLFWRPTPPAGIVVDPQKEAQRLRQNAALGQSPEIGNTPIIQPRRQGWFEGLF